MNPLFSIVMPVLNQVRFVERALDSVVPQSKGRAELIVVDGGSSDGSLEVLKRYEEHFSWWCSERDGGQSEALNKGFSHARGRFLVWLNADDVLMPGALDAVEALISRRPDAKWIVGNLVYIDEGDRVLYCACDGRWHDFLFRWAPVRVYGPSSFFERSLFEAAGGFDAGFHYMMDTDLWMRFKGLGVRFVRVNCYLWGFRVHGASKTAGDLAGKTPPEMAGELQILVNRYHLKLGRGCWLQRLWRCLNGCYVRSWWDTHKKKRGV